MLTALKIVVGPLLGVLTILAAPQALNWGSSSHHSAVPAQERPDWGVQDLPGTLMFGGGCFVDAIGAEFVRLAGGKDARIVIIPTAYGGTEAEGIEQFEDEWSRWEPASIEILHCRNRAEADDAKLTQGLQTATGVWFTGGDQSRLLDAVQNTQLHRELARVLERGGVVGGNCAGAMVLGEMMIVRGKEPVILRRGLNVARQLVIDAHWLERNRIERLRQIVQQHPGCLGLGIDRETAVVLQGGELRFVGNSYAATVAPVPGPRGVRFDVWAAEDVVDLRELLAPGSE
jgi:cyanophycinase